MLDFLSMLDLAQNLQKRCENNRCCTWAVRSVLAVQSGEKLDDRTDVFAVSEASDGLGEAEKCEHALCPRVYVSTAPATIAVGAVEGEGSGLAVWRWWRGPLISGNALMGLLLKLASFPMRFSRLATRLVCVLAVASSFAVDKRPPIRATVLLSH